MHGLQLEYSFSASSVSGSAVSNLGSSGAALNGKLVNGATVGSYGSGSSSYVTLVAASSQYVQIPTFSTGNTGLSFSIWFKSTSLTSTWGRLFDFGNGAASDNIIMFLNAENLGLSVYVGSDADQLYNIIDSMEDGLWRHVVWTLDPSGTWVVYENGVQLWSSQGRYYPKAMARFDNYLGKSNWNDPFFDGSISDFRMYSYVLSVADVKSLYSSSASLPVPTAQPTYTSRPSVSLSPTGE